MSGNYGVDLGSSSDATLRTITAGPGTSGPAWELADVVRELPTPVQELLGSARDFLDAIRKVTKPFHHCFKPPSYNPHFQHNNSQQHNHSPNLCHYHHHKHSPNHPHKPNQGIKSSMGRGFEVLLCSTWRVVREQYHVPCTFRRIPDLGHCM